jgi:hypothetical protein
MRRFKMAFLTVSLEDENGNNLESLEDNGLLGSHIPPVSDKTYCCTKYIDLYGNTIFNRLQMDDFIEEMKIIQGKSENPHTKDIIDNIIKLANKSKSKPHLYLKFYGD